MGINDLQGTGGNGQDIDASLVDQHTTALKGPLVPRNSQGRVADEAGSLGTPPYQWSEVHAVKYFKNGKELVTGGSTGGAGSIAPGVATRNAVVSGLEPASRPGMAGWLHQAGANGIVITASTADPLVVKLDGVNYTRASNITGGTLPSDYSQVVTLPRSASYEAPRSVQANTRAPYYYGTGGVFPFDNPSSNAELVPASYGDVIIIKSTGGGRDDSYMVLQRASEDVDGRRNLGKLAVGAGMNTSPTAQHYPAFNTPWNTTHRVIRAGHLFTDPLSVTWQLGIAKRIAGSVDVELPPAAGIDAGDVVFREADQRWYRFSGSAWEQTSWVYLALLAIDNGQVEAVMPTRTELALGALLEAKEAVLGAPMSREGVVQGSTIYYGGDTSGDLETKGMAELGGQSFHKVGSDALVDTSNAEAGTLRNNALFCVYYDVAGASYGFEEVAPQWRLHQGRLLLLHPSKHALYVGSFATDDSGNLIAQARVGKPGTPRAELKDNTDYTWLVNPHLFGRVKCTDLPLHTGNGGRTWDREVQVKIRGHGTGASLSENSYRWPGNSFWNGNMRNREDWDRLFYSRLNAFAIEQIWFDVAHSTAIKLEFSQWDEASLLHAAGLAAAAREGQAQAAGAAGGAVASVDAPQLAEGAVGADALGQGAVGPRNLLATNEAVAGTIPKVVVDGDRVMFRFETGGGGAPADGTLTYAMQAASAIASEEDVLAPDADDLKLVNNLVLHDMLDDIRDSIGGWQAWGAVGNTNITGWANNANLSLNGTTEHLLGITGNGSLKNITLQTGRLHLVAKEATGRPTLSSGALRGWLAWLDPAGVRWVQPITNPEGADAETFFRLVNGTWEAVGYRDDELETDWAGPMAEAAWVAMSSLANGRPAGNAFNDEPAVTRMIATGQAAVRAVYDTSNSRFTIIASQRARLGLVNSTQQVYTRTFANRLRNSTAIQNLDAGMSLAGYHFITMKLQGQYGGTLYTYYSPAFDLALVKGENNELIGASGFGIDIINDTTFKLTNTRSDQNSGPQGIVGLVASKYILQ